MKKLILFLTIFISVSLTAQTKLPSFFGDNMVLQQNDSVAIWGTDKPNYPIIISSSWSKEVTTKSDENGNWKTKIATLKADNKPYTLNVKR